MRIQQCVKHVESHVPPIPRTYNDPISVSDASPLHPRVISQQHHLMSLYTSFTLSLYLRVFMCVRV